MKIRISLSVFAIFLVGCASSLPLVDQRLDTGTGVTITFTNVPLILFRDDPSHAAYARNYMQLGPIQVNRNGNHHHFLWLGAWSNMQSNGLSEQNDALSTIVIFVDGQPLALELSGSSSNTIGTSEPVYLKPAASSLDAYYRVTGDHIRLIAQADDLRLHTSGVTGREYQPWDVRLFQKAMQEFLQQTDF